MMLAIFKSTPYSPKVSRAAQDESLCCTDVALWLVCAL
jgi:hypothetical protein